ncbi:hypothetical protein [Undibacterium curvum]|uniref:hypothetical protein n=1 Tax=Undibacterium curvum TaxID=2762294 RepID=UPI003D11CB47
MNRKAALGSMQYEIDGFLCLRQGIILLSTHLKTLKILIYADFADFFATNSKEA